MIDTINNINAYQVVISNRDWDPDNLHGDMQSRIVDSEEAV